MCDKLIDEVKDEFFVVVFIKDKFDKVELLYEDLKVRIIELEGRL